MGTAIPPPTPEQTVLGSMQKPLAVAKAGLREAEPPAQWAMPPASGDNASFRAINFSSCYPRSAPFHRSLLIFPSLLTTKYGWHLVGDLKPGQLLPPCGLDACCLAPGGLSELGA